MSMTNLERVTPWNDFLDAAREEGVSEWTSDTK